VWPDDGGTMPSENYIFTTHVDPVSPPSKKRWWRRRVPPPGP